MYVSLPFHIWIQFPKSEPERTANINKETNRSLRISINFKSENERCVERWVRVEFVDRKTDQKCNELPIAANVVAKLISIGRFNPDSR